MCNKIKVVKSSESRNGKSADLYEQSTIPGREGAIVASASSSVPNLQPSSSGDRFVQPLR